MREIWRVRLGMRERDKNAVAENQHGNAGNLGGDTKNVGNQGGDAENQGRNSSIVVETHGQRKELKLGEGGG